MAVLRNLYPYIDYGYLICDLIFHDLKVHIEGKKLWSPRCAGEELNKENETTAIDGQLVQVPALQKPPRIKHCNFWYLPLIRSTVLAPKNTRSISVYRLRKTTLFTEVHVSLTGRGSPLLPHLIIVVRAFLSHFSDNQGGMALLMNNPEVDGEFRDMRILWRTLGASASHEQG